MGMQYSILGVTPDQQVALRASPSLADALILVAEEEQYSADHPEYPPSNEIIPGYRDCLKAARIQLAGLSPPERVLGLQRIWLILHYCITGDAGPTGSAGGALLSGEEVGEDTGYGRPRLIDSQATRAFANFLERLGLDDVIRNVDYRKMVESDVCSAPFGEETKLELESELKEDVAIVFPLLRGYVVGMAEKKNGLLTWLS
jgi:Domain of unknown function (DUF1877)